MAHLGLVGRCELTVVGPLANSVLDVIRSRFDVVATATADGTVLTVAGVDQAAIRSLLIMLWDSGHEVLAMTACQRRPP